MRFFIFMVAAACAMAADDGTAAGRVAYEKRCGGCHGVDTTKAGPPLRGIAGRRAGTQPEFPYSDALKASRVVWTRQTLDRWLADPESVAPGTDMAFRLDSKTERALIIGYLEHLR